EVEGVGDVVVGDMPVVDVESAGQGRIVRQGLVPSLIGDLDGEGQSRVRQRRGRGAGYGPGHVRHAVVDRVVDGERRIVVRGGRGSPEAAAWSDGEAAADRTRRQARDQPSGDELRRLLAGVEHGADDAAGTARDFVISYLFDTFVAIAPEKVSSICRRRGMLMSMTSTFAPRPRAMRAAFVPATPAPMTTTFARSTPGTPGSRMPRPPLALSRLCAPTCVDRRPAISLIGARSGSPPPSGWTVS